MARVVTDKKEKRRDGRGSGEAGNRSTTDLQADDWVNEQPQQGRTGRAPHILLLQVLINLPQGISGKEQARIRLNEETVTPSGNNW